MTKKIVSYNIRRYRKDAGYTQDSLGEAIGVDGHTVQNWERSRTFPSPDNIDSLCDKLRISADQLFAVKRPAEPISEGRSIPVDVLEKLLLINPLKWDDIRIALSAHVSPPADNAARTHSRKPSKLRHDQPK